MKNIFSSIKLPDEDFHIFLRFFSFGGGEKEFMLIIKKREHEKEKKKLFCLLVLVEQIRGDYEPR